MNALAQAERLWSNLLALGMRRLAALAIVGLGVTVATIAIGYYFSRPINETLYTGLDRGDVVSIGAALKEAGIAFDVNADGTSIVVAMGQGSVARMTLAEKGLPHSGSVGNELFDKLGSLGLTSFMQEVTRVRAIEGELGRTIQMMRGIKAARVHIVMGDEGSFRREKQPPSASIVVRTDGSDDRSAGQAIRHLVAAAVPNMKVDQVTVVNVDGRLLVAGPDSIEKSPDNLLALEKEVTQEIRERIAQTLAPYLSRRNFQVSVAAKLNADHKQTNETIYDPESRAERSVRVVKEQQTSKNAAGQPTAGVESNLPKTGTSSGETKQSNDDKQKREELTNYEISSKSIVTTSAGFTIDRLSIAVLINRAAIASSLGDKATPEAVDKQVTEIEQLVGSVAGLHKDRGDIVKISVVDFVDSAHDLEPVAGPSLSEILIARSGPVINAGAALLVVAMLIWFGLRPVTKALLAPPVQNVAELAAGQPMLAMAPPSPPSEPEPNLLIEAEGERDQLLVSLLARKDRASQRQLQKLVDFDEEQVAKILKQWIRQGAIA